MDNVSERLSYYRNLKGISLGELSKLTGIPKTNLQRYEKGTTKKIPMDIIPIIEKALFLEKGTLMGWDYNPSFKDGNSYSPTKHKVPVLGKVVAGYPLETVENILDYEEISEEMARQGEFFALQIKGNSMEPKFSEGDIVIVRKQEDVNNGDIAIILVNGDEATIKKIQKFEGGINLIPSNLVYDVITYSNKEIEELPVRCLGKVVELRAKF